MNSVRSALGLGLAGLLAAGFIELVWLALGERVRAAEYRAENARVRLWFADYPFAGVPSFERFFITDSTLSAPSGAPAWIARVDNRIQAVAIQVLATDGYGGDIQLLVVTSADGRLHDIHILGHDETPGYGAQVALVPSPWLRSMRGYSLRDIPETAWAIAADGGRFDALTSATVTSRAVLSAVRRALIRQAVAAKPSTSPRFEAFSRDDAEQMAGLDGRYRHISAGIRRCRIHCFCGADVHHPLDLDRQSRGIAVTASALGGTDAPAGFPGPGCGVDGGDDAGYQGVFP